MWKAVAPEECDELFPVVDENDAPVGTERRKIVHARHLRHRSAHVLVFNSAGDVLIQLRSASKDEYPLYWDVSVGGHVAPGETYEQAAQRELQEELGLTGEIRFLRRTAASEQTSWEFTNLYMLTTDQPPRLNPQEIATCEFVAPTTLLEEIRAGRRRVTPVLANEIAFYLKMKDAESGKESGQRETRAGEVIPGT